ncbi:helix-turn-helix domain-containing protein [Thermodesulfobacteriota bacterium]
MEPLLNATQIAKLLSVSKPLVYTMVKRRQLPCVIWPSFNADGEKKGSVIRFEKEVVLRFIEDHRSNGEG